VYIARERLVLNRIQDISWYVWKRLSELGLGSDQIANALDPLRPRLSKYGKKVIGGVFNVGGIHLIKEKEQSR
jgi:hypothetical protein